MKTGDAEKGKKKGKKKIISDERGWGRGRKDWAEESIMPYANKLTTFLLLNILLPIFQID